DASSAARSCSRGIWPASACVRRSLRLAGRSRLPTWSARNGGRAAMDRSSARIVRRTAGVVKPSRVVSSRAMSQKLPLLPTTVVGSYPQPEWLIDRSVLLGSTVARVGLPKLWCVPDEIRATAEDDAVRLVLRDMERAGVDIVSDGEVRRESYFNWLAPRLTGIDVERPGSALSRTGRPTAVPRVVGDITRPAPVLKRTTEFVRRETDQAFKITMPGP